MAEGDGGGGGIAAGFVVSGGEASGRRDRAAGGGAGARGVCGVCGSGGVFAEISGDRSALDTIPYNGHTTSLDALWMGVAVLSRVGRTVVGRAGVSQMFQLGLMEFVAETDEQFVETAVKWAADLEGLERLRASLRGKMEGSALMDGKRFARHIEAAFGRMWEEYVAGDSCQRGS